MRALWALLEPKTKRILEVFDKNRAIFYHLQKLSQDAHVPLASVFRIVRKLEADGIIDTVLVGRTKLYLLPEPKELNLLKALDKKMAAVLSLLATNKERFFHLQQLASESGVPLATVFRIVKKLSAAQTIETVHVGKLAIYRIKQEVAEQLHGQ
jgi:uncharacterized membrane protein